MKPTCRKVTWDVKGLAHIGLHQERENGFLLSYVLAKNVRYNDTKIMNDSIHLWYL